MLNQDRIKHLMRLAYQHASLCSHDTSTQVGAIIITANSDVILGANRFTHPSFDTPENQVRPQKYQFIEHAERWAIYEAVRLGCSLKDAVLICPWASCTDCARAIVRSGIQKVYAHQDAYDKTPKRWQEIVNNGIEILEASGVPYVRYSGKIGGCTNLFDGKVWYP